VKLLDLTEFYSPQGGGVRTYLAAKAHWCATQPDLEHIIVVTSDRDGVEQWSASRVHLIAGPPVLVNPGYHFLVGAARLAAILRREAPDVIELGSLYLAPWLLRRALQDRRPLVTAFYHEDTRAIYKGHAFAWAPSPLKWALDRLVARYLKAALARVDLALAATPRGGAALAALGVRDTAVVPLGVDTALFHPARRDPAWKHEVGAPADQPVALYVGRLSSGKCLGVVLNALPEVHRSTGLSLVVIGAGHERRSLERWARAHPGLLHVAPYEADRARLARAYASADLCIAPGPYETFGLAALEAMASGVPLVGVRSGAIGDLLAGADWGEAYRAGDARDCARALRDILGALPGRGARARAVALERYGWDRTFSALVERYRELVQSRPRPPRASNAPPSTAPRISV
jgi:alpha-1,6-mannosyltransferase